MPGACAKRAVGRALGVALAAACAVGSSGACRRPPVDEPEPAAAMPALVFGASAACDAAADGRDCPRPTRLTVLLVNPQGLTAPESVQVALEPRRRWGVPERDVRVRRGRFSPVSAPSRAAAAFDSLAPGRYVLRLGRPGGELVLWRLVIARGCWSRLEIWVDSRAAADALAPSAATLYSCPDPE